MKNVIKAYNTIARLLDRMGVDYHIDDDIDDVYNDECLSAIICDEPINKMNGIFIASVWETDGMVKSLCLGEEAIDMNQADIDKLNTEEDLIKMLWDYARFDLKKILKEKEENSITDESLFEGKHNRRFVRISHDDEVWNEE